MPLPKRRFLDPRPLEVCLASPFEDAVNIPLDELNMRSHELPRPGKTVPVVADSPLAEAAGEWLRSAGRTWERVTPRAEASYVPGRLWSPHPMVEELCSERAPGMAWDYGCGTGRDAIFLASEGWHVVAIDRLPDALERAGLTERRLLPGPTIDWRIQDFHLDPSLPEGGPDLVSMFFFLDRALLRRAGERLALGGQLLLEVFTPAQRESTGRPRSPELVLNSEEVTMLLPDLQFRECSEEWRDGRHTLRVWAEKI